jgi:folate-binding protein YgfZ
MLQHSIPDSSAFSTGYQAARHKAASFRRLDRGRIVVSGRDRATYLHGLLTNDIASLTAGQGCYAAYLTAQGRMITDLYVYELGDVMLLSMQHDVKDAVLAKLDQFIFTEDVQLGDATDSFAALCVVGPEAAQVVSALTGGKDPREYEDMQEHASRRVQFAGEPLIVLRVADAGVAGFELLIDGGRVAALDAAVRNGGAAAIDSGTVEALRIEGGRPKFHVDMDEETIPLEAAIEARAISMTKGCYVGQEVIVRVLHRGHGRVARKLVGLVVAGNALPRAGEKISAAGKEIGSVTSAVISPSLKRPIALAYVHRDFVEPGTAVAVGDSAATVSALPFVAA